MGSQRATASLALQVRFEWSPAAWQRLSASAVRQLLPALRDAALRFCGSPRYCSGGVPPAVQEAVRRAEATSRLIDGVAWSSPALEDPSKAGGPGSATAVSPQKHGLLHAHPSMGAAGMAAAGGRPPAWSWHAPLDAEWLAALAGASGGGGAAAHHYAPPPDWQLQAAVLHELRAHKDRLRLCFADEEQQVRACSSGLSPPTC